MISLQEIKCTVNNYKECGLATFATLLHMKFPPEPKSNTCMIPDHVSTYAIASALAGAFIGTLSVAS